MNNAKWVEILKQVGFPIVVAMILLMQITPALNRLTTAMDRQNVLLERLEKTGAENQRLATLSQDLLQNITQLLIALLDGGTTRGPRGR